MACVAGERLVSGAALRVRPGDTLFFLASQGLFWAAALLLLRRWTWRKRLAAGAALTPFALYTLTLISLGIFHLTTL